MAHSASSMFSPVMMRSVVARRSAFPSFRPLRRERVLKKQRLDLLDGFGDFDRARARRARSAVHVDPYVVAERLPRQHIGSIQLARLFRTDAGGVLLHVDAEHVVDIDFEGLNPRGSPSSFCARVAPLDLLRKSPPGACE